MPTAELPPRTAEYVTELATRAVNRFGGHLPEGTSREDAIQEACVVILDWWDRWNARAYAVDREPFLVMKAWSTLKDKFGKDWRVKYHEPPEAPTPSLPTEVVPDQIDTEQLRMDVRDAIAKLTRRESQIMRKVMKGQTQTQVAKDLGVTQPYVSQIVKKCRIKLAQFLEDYR